MIFDAIASKLKFSYTINLPQVCCMWGDPIQGENNFTGLLGDLYNGFSDIGIANLFDVPEYRKAMDVTNPYTIDYSCFLVNYM
jgi:hypothetical protein